MGRNRRRGRKESKNLLPKDQIKTVIGQGWYKGYYDFIARQEAYAYGSPQEKWLGQYRGGTDEFHYPDLESDWSEIGKSMRILQTSMAIGSRLFSTIPSPSFPQVDDVTEGIRKSFWEKRYTEGDWSDEVTRAFQDLDALGVGIVRGGVVDTDDGYQKVHLKYVPLKQCVWDRLCTHPSRSRWVAFFLYYPLEQAKELYGSVVEDYVFSMDDGLSSNSTCTPLVRVIEYYDIGLEGKAPTKATIFGSPKNEPWKVERNPFGRLPVASGMHFCPSGMRRPVGRIKFQMASQEQLNAIEEKLIEASDAGAGQYMVWTDKIVEDDLEKVMSGESVRFIRMEGDPEAKDKPAIQIVPPMEVSNATMNLYKLMSNEHNSQAGLSDLDRGILSSARNTATEIAQMQNSLAANQSWIVLQTKLFIADIVQMVIDIAVQYDTCPVDIDVLGHTIKINDPENYQLGVDKAFEEPSQIKISSESLTSDEDRAKRSAKFQELAALAPVAQGLDQEWLLREYLKAYGMSDPTEAMKSEDGVKKFSSALSQIVQNLEPEQQQAFGAIEQSMTPEQMQAAQQIISAHVA